MYRFPPLWEQKLCCKRTEELIGQVLIKHTGGLIRWFLWAFVYRDLQEFLCIEMGGTARLFHYLDTPSYINTRKTFMSFHPSCIFSCLLVVVGMYHFLRKIRLLFIILAKAMKVFYLISHLSLLINQLHANKPVTKISMSVPFWAVKGSIRSFTI